MRPWMVIFVLVLSAPLWANQLEIQGPFRPQVGQDLQLRAYYYGTGTRRDVTWQVRWSSFDLRHRGTGRFEVPLCDPGQTQYHAAVEATWTSDDTGRYVSARKSYWIDCRPDTITIENPSYMTSGQSYQLRAMGRYGVKTHDITRLGTWSAQKGSLLASGYYTAPANESEDVITFRYAGLTQTKTLNLYE